MKTFLVIKKSKIIRIFRKYALYFSRKKMIKIILKIIIFIGR